MRGALALSLSTVALAGCGGSAPPAETPPTAAPAPSPAQPAPTPTEDDPKLAASLDGAAVELKFAVASSPGGSAIELRVGSYDFGCPGQGGGMVPDDGMSVTLTLAPTLGKDGQRDWRVVYSSFDGSSRQSDQGSVTVKGDATKGAIVTLPKLEFVGAGEKPRTLTLSGATRARGCGAPAPRDGDPAPAPQDHFTLTIAGQTLPIVGALLERRAGGEDTLVLSTSPLSCERQPWNVDAILAVTARKGAPDSAFLRGALFTAQMSAGFGSAQTPPKWALGKEKDGRVEVTFAAKWEHTGYPIDANGKLDVPACKKD